VTFKSELKKEQAENIKQLLMVKLKQLWWILYVLVRRKDNLSGVLVLFLCFLQKNARAFGLIVVYALNPRS
jgi:hypothetical protein